MVLMALNCAGLDSGCLVEMGVRDKVFPSSPVSLREPWRNITFGSEINAEGGVCFVISYTFTCPTSVPWEIQSG